MSVERLKLCVSNQSVGIGGDALQIRVMRPTAFRRVAAHLGHHIPPDRTVEILGSTGMHHFEHFGHAESRVQSTLLQLTDSDEDLLSASHRSMVGVLRSTRHNNLSTRHVEKIHRVEGGS